MKIVNDIAENEIHIESGDFSGDSNSKENSCDFYN